MTDLDPNRRFHRWAEVDVGAITSNVRTIRDRLPETSRLIAVVKADGYGHGAVPASRAALKGGAWGLAVATLEEAAALRDACVPERILVMGGLVAEDAPDAVRKGFAVTCSNRESLSALQAEGKNDPDRGVPVHLEIDTGMGRLGCRPGDAPALAEEIAGSPGLRLAGTYTHFASSDSDDAMTRRQYDCFLEVLAHFSVDPGIRHACNSLAALRHPEMALDAVRVGIAMYGCEDPGLTPAMNVKCLVVHVKTVEPGQSVGYGSTWTAEKPTRVATASIGYADGVFRNRSNTGWTLVKGRKAPLIGRVSMDLVTIDVTSIPDVRVGDTVTVLGTDGEEEIRPELAAEWTGTISYEVLTSVGPRVVRRYRE